jgi:hypothetical protein
MEEGMRRSKFVEIKHPPPQATTHKDWKGEEEEEGKRGERQRRGGGWRSEEGEMEILRARTWRGGRER